MQQQVVQKTVSSAHRLRTRVDLPEHAALSGMIARVGLSESYKRGSQRQLLDERAFLIAVAGFRIDFMHA